MSAREFASFDLLRSLWGGSKRSVLSVVKRTVVELRFAEFVLHQGREHQGKNRCTAEKRSSQNHVTVRTETHRIFFRLQLLIASTS